MRPTSMMIVVSGLQMIFFRRVYNFGYSKQLFLIMHAKYDVSNIPHFYQSLMNTWSLFSHQKVTPPSAVNGIPFEPLWYNSYVTHNSNIITDTVIQHDPSKALM